jgi:hypothetical protein
VPKGQVSWDKARKRRKVERVFEPPKEEKEELLLPLWMKAKKTILVILPIFVCLTVVAFFVEILGYVFVVVGIGIMIGTYFVGGGMSEWTSRPGITTHSQKAFRKYRYEESASNWAVIVGGFVVGGFVFLSGVLALVLGTFL